MTSSADNLTEIEQLRAQLKKQMEINQSLSTRVEILEEVVRHLKIKRFMPSSEKTNADQFLLFDEAELCTDPKLEQYEKDQDKKNGKDNDTKLRGRKPLSSDLPRKQIFLYLSDEEKTGAKSTVRPFVVGRKAWLFADTSQGAKASATCYSLVETAKLNGLEPHGYLQTLLTELPNADTVEKVEALLPWNLAKD